MQRLILLLGVLAGLSYAEPPAYGPYDDAELDAVTRSLVAALLAIVIHTSSLFQLPRSKRPAWEIGLAQVIQTGFLALVAVLVVRWLSDDNLAAEWLTGAVVGIRGPKAVDWLLEVFGRIWPKKGGRND